ncbi:MAG: hypothetical protein OEW75_08275 [Cyclobacteriaceae bacterium]|nr:hypothetical protein [Cyclobacteriaceae bacterium]
MTRKSQFVWVFAGIMAAILILVSQSGYYYFKNETQQKVFKSEKQDENKSSERNDLLFQANDAVAQVVQFSFGHVLHFIYSIPHVVTITIPILDPGDIIPVKVYMETLLQKIISPNAP